MSVGRPLMAPRSNQHFDAAPCCVAHRGARAYAPENTLPAFRKAGEMGCAMIELDVHLSRDGELVVHHDDSLVRCTNVCERYGGRGSNYLSDFTLAELRQLDAGSWFVGELALPAPARQAFLRSLTNGELEQWVTPQDLALYEGGAIRLPTLYEVLELALELDLMVNIEIKTIPRMYPGIAAKVVHLVASMGLQQSVLISSFDHVQLLAVRQLSANLNTGVLTSDRLARPADYLRSLDADAYHPGCYGDYDTLGFGSVSGSLETAGIDAVRSTGYKVFAWTCNDGGQMQELLANGISGMITDYPNRFAEVLANA